MTALSDLLNDAKGDESVDALLDRTEKRGTQVSRTARSSIYKALSGDHAKNPREETLQLWALVFDLDIREMRQAVDKPAGELGPWEPTPESARLDRDQRIALNNLIKTIVKGGGLGAAGSSPATKDPDVGPGNQTTPGLSVVPDRTDDAVAALDEEVSTVGEHGESDDA